nr:helix-hairpin-helix domain-containing protein [Eubacterium sp.]
MKLNNSMKALLIVLLILAGGTLYLTYNQGSSGDQPVLKTEEANKSQENQALAKDSKIYIHILGAVKKPGVYVFDQEPRLIKVVKKAGGFTKKADRTSVNLAQIVTDGTQLKVEEKAGDKESKDQKSESQKVNINTADAEELMTITGVGQAKANQIIAYREENGSFHTIEDIMNISGIKEGVFNTIKDFIT